MIGRVVSASNVSLGIGGCYIALVDASNVSEEYYNTTSDANGNYWFTDVNATYSSVQGISSHGFSGNSTMGTNAYKIYANKDPYGEGYSAAFGIDENQASATTTSVILTRPARIELRAERAHVTNDDFDNIKITAYMYDALGNPVADGLMINFTVGNATNNIFRNPADFVWSGHNNVSAGTVVIDYPNVTAYEPYANGSLAGENNTGNKASSMTTGNAGIATTQFGWLDDNYGGNNSTIWAYYADNASIFANIKIYFASPTSSWAGRLVDSFGTGCDGIPVTLHVMGMDGTTPYEIYNMTRTTHRNGTFAFDYIVMNGVAYGYVDASVRLTDNLTMYGKSGNLSMNRLEPSIGTIVLNWSATSIGTIVLQAPTPTPAPSATRTTDNIRAIGLIIVIVLTLITAGVAYYLLKKR